MENPHVVSPESESQPQIRYNLPGYLALFSTQKISVLGSEIVSFALIWWLSLTYASVAVLSTATFMSLLPMILISPFAGVLCDRSNRRNIMLFTDLAQAIATIGLIGLFSQGIVKLHYIYVLLAIRGLMQGLQVPAGISIMASMVPPNHLNRMNSLNSLLSSLISIAGPGLGALAITLFPIATIYWLDVITFIPAALMLIRVFIPSISGTGEEEKSKGTHKLHFIADIKDALHYLAHTGLYSLILLFTFVNFFVIPLFSLMPKYFQGDLQSTAFQYSYFQIALQIGYIAATLYIMRPKNAVPKFRGFFITEIITLFAVGLMAAVRPQFIWLAYGLAVIQGLTMAIIDVQMGTILQIMVPRELLGRVFASLFTLVKALLPIGLIILGFLADYVGIRWLLIISPCLALVISLGIFAFTPLLKLKVELIKNQIQTTSTVTEANDKTVVE